MLGSSRDCGSSGVGGALCPPCAVPGGVLDGRCFGEVTPSLWGQSLTGDPTWGQNPPRPMGDLPTGGKPELEAGPRMPLDHCP